MDDTFFQGTKIIQKILKNEMFHKKDRQEFCHQEIKFLLNDSMSNVCVTLTESFFPEIYAADTNLRAQ